MSIFAVGDIHGCSDKLERLLDRLPFVPERDTLVFLGDYINRGPDTRLVLERLLAVREECPGAVFLMGNHEQALLRYAETGDVEYLRVLRTLGVEQTLTSYGRKTMRSLGDLSFLPPDHLDFLRSLLPHWRHGRFLFAHAGVALREGASTPGELEASLAVRPGLIRSLEEEAEGETAELVVFGHTSFETPFVAEGLVGIDTGACHGNLLTAVELSASGPAGVPGLRFHHA
ncbi:metallophosphoesterase [Desulfovibrio sp. X2]|uniref:metallophosphoesterase n=1 Tax=Desulfovibrio sp. X2 TaxID=941449 RepID=UPI00035894B6|nr:metallophosphoesterase [Desulfovibrio sp. X2]EPR44271.1 metallophosphoesterase [Desulfovibrio sp. X2]